MTTGKPVVVKHLPENLGAQQCQAFFRDLQPALETDRPRLVFDFRNVRQLDSAGVEFLLRCMEEAMKRNGDLKLSSVSPQLAVILEMTRVDRLFEIFDNSTDAVESFHRFSASAWEPMAPPVRSNAKSNGNGKGH
jgi:anti-sigma B factor antagonist